MQLSVIPRTPHKPDRFHNRIQNNPLDIVLFETY